MDIFGVLIRVETAGSAGESPEIHQEKKREFWQRDRLQRSKRPLFTPQTSFPFQAQRRKAD